MPRRKIAVVPPRYGPDIIGGAEAVLRETAEALVARGWEVEALTTCARSHFTWENEFNPGVETIAGVTVRRFPTVPPWDARRKGELEAAIMAGVALSVSEQQEWANAGMRVPTLFDYIMDHGHEYGALIYAPYLFWTTYACAQLWPDRTVLMPCLHDEPFAYLDVFEPLFHGSRDIWFLSEPEQQLAQRIFGRTGDCEVTGSGIAVPESYDPDGFRRKYGIQQRFLLYAGRREGGKGWERLLEQLASICDRTTLPFSLVTCGGGDVHPPAAIADRVIDLGFLPEEDKPGAFAAADAYIQPSALESFSRTVLEAWAAGTVVIANDAGEVVRWHCERSGAGLTYADEYELEACLSFVAAQPDEAGRLAQAGREYVLDNYRWEPVLARLERRLEAMA